MKLLMGLILFFSASTCWSSILTVSNTNDAGVGSLRWAVASALQGDTIYFNASTNNTSINLTSGQIALNKRLSIIGNGMNTTIISGSNSSRIFFIENTGTSSDTIRIQKLSIQHGYSSGQGGGISDNANPSYMISLFQVEVEYCYSTWGGGGICIGHGEINTCYIHHNQDIYTGGGVYANYYPVNFINSTIAYNNSEYIGGINFNGPSDVTNCLIYANHATSTAPNQGIGGFNANGKIRNCTIANNIGGQIGGLAHGGYSDVELSNNIIYGNNGGDVYIFIDNTFGSGQDEASYHQNIVGSCELLGSTTETCPVWYSSYDPWLNPAGLETNTLGIPYLRVMCGSIALDVAYAGAAPVSDQNGNPRLEGADIGSVESGAVVETGVANMSNQLISSANGATYQWLDCNNSMAIIGGATNQNFIPTANGSYAVEVYLGGCTDTSVCEIIDQIGISEYSQQEIISVSPNPTEGFISFSEPVDFVLYTMNGQQLVTGSSTKTADLSHLPPDVYILEINYLERIIRSKLVRQ